jgi:RNA polymerase sigma factor, sigma-70 family
MRMESLTAARSAHEGERIAAQARGGDADRERLFAELWRSRWAPLVAFLSSLGLDPDEAEDAAQDSLFRAFERILDYDPSRPFATWLYAIGKNRARDLLRSKRARPASQLADAEDSIEASYDGPAALSEREDEAAFMRRFLRALPGGYAAAVELVYGQGMSCAEAAASLGLPTGTVKWRLHEVRRRLKAAWEAENA